jgi:tetratricopeptide (TPR) repeat protein
VPGLILGILITALVLVLIWPTEIWAALGNLPGPDTATPRAVLHRNSLILVHDYALLGAGLDSYMMLYSTYALLIHVGHSMYSHNLLLDVAIQQGLPSVLMLLVAWTLFAVAAWRGLWRPAQRQGSAHSEAGSLDERGLLGAAGLSLVVTVTHGLGDDIYYSSGAILLLFVPLAFAAPYLAVPGRAGDRGGNRRWLVALPAGLVLLLALVWRGPLLSLVFSNLGAVHQSQAELSVYEWPAWPIQDALRREIDLGRPVAEYERALALDPSNASANRRLGQIELSLGEYEDALRHLERAYAAESSSPTTQMLYGEALLVNGRLDEGQALWAGLSPGEGQFQGRAFWYQHIGDAQRAAWIEQASSSR